MELLKGPPASSLLVLCGWLALSAARDPLGLQVRINAKTIKDTAMSSLTEGTILQDLAAAAYRNQSDAEGINGITELKVTDMQRPEIEMVFKPEGNVLTQMINVFYIAGKSFIGGMMEITVLTNTVTSTLWKMTTEEEGTLSKRSTLVVTPEKKITLKISSCSVDLISYKTNLPSSMLPKIVNKFLNSTLVKILPTMMCPAADKVVTYMEKKFESLYEKHPVGNEGTMWYEIAEEPKVFADYIEIFFKNKFQKSNNEMIDISPDPPLPDEVPPKEEGKSAIYVPVNVLNAFMKMMEGKMNCVVTTKEAASLTTDHLNGLLPSAGLPAGKELRATITQNETPKFTLGPDGSYLTYFSTVSFEADGKKLLSVNMEFEVPSDFAIENEKLKITLKSSTGRTAMVSSSEGNIDVEPLKEYLQTLMDSTCIPKDNEILEQSTFTLPSLMGANYSPEGSTVTEAKDTLALNVETEGPDEATIQAILKSIQGPKKRN